MQLPPELRNEWPLGCKLGVQSQSDSDKKGTLNSPKQTEPGLAAEALGLIGVAAVSGPSETASISQNRRSTIGARSR